MDPGLLLLVFLPVLIFASANALDFHTFKQCFGQVIPFLFVEFGSTNPFACLTAHPLQEQETLPWFGKGVDVLLQVLILAGPGVVMGTCVIGVCMKYLFPYNWNWSKSLMFGAMMSATDPVAVVALLKEVSSTSFRCASPLLRGPTAGFQCAQVGASQKLGTVIEGESLFNDGTAYVVFLLFKVDRWISGLRSQYCSNLLT